MRKSASHENKSLKTFFVYTAIVLFFIFISLSVKAFFVIRASQFDGDHQFLLSVNKEQKVKEIISFDPSSSEVSILELKGDIPAITANQQIGYIPDASVELGERYESDTDASKILRTIGFHYNSIKTDLTLFDVIRLAILSHKTPDQPRTNEIKNFFIDEAIVSEDVSIQIINASDMSGMGKRLETVLSNLGYNVVSITTSAKQEKNSKIQYFGNETYTLDKIEQILKFPVVKLDNKQIADIIIIIGEESENLNTF